MGENTGRTRPITFPYVGEIKGSKVWRNAETGVEIIRDPNGLYYAGIPTIAPEGRGERPITTLATSRTRAGARKHAVSFAETVREEIAAAHAEAHAEALAENWARRPEADRRNARIMVDMVSVAVDAPGQLTAWRTAHGIPLGVDGGATVEDYIAAFEGDHAEALAWNAHLGENHMTGRIVRRAQYEAFRAVLCVLDGWVAGALENHEAMSHRDDDCCRAFGVDDIRRMVNDAARELDVRRPWNGDAR